MTERESASKIFIFTGPSLHSDHVLAHLDATVLPPIKRGDLDHLTGMRPAAIGIIDGEFYQSLAVSTKEILPFLDAGVRVYGASSIGALRAVELQRDGMIGVGRVFRLFRSGILDDDDEVALAYCPKTFESTSEPLVNLRYVVRAAVKQKILTRVEAAEVIGKLKEVYFPERTRRLLLFLARGTAGRDAESRMKILLSDGVVNVKELDALRLIHRIRRDRALAPLGRSSECIEAF